MSMEPVSAEVPTVAAVSTKETKAIRSLQAARAGALVAVFGELCGQRWLPQLSTLWHALLLVAITCCAQIAAGGDAVSDEVGCTKPSDCTESSVKSDLHAEANGSQDVYSESGFVHSQDSVGEQFGRWEEETKRATGRQKTQEKNQNEIQTK